MVFEAIRQKFLQANTPRHLMNYEQVLKESVRELKRKEDSLARLEERLREKDSHLNKRSKQYEKVINFEKKLRQEQSKLKIEAAKLAKLLKEWKYKDSAHKAWKIEHKRTMEQLNKRAEAIEHQEEALRLERERIVQQQRLLKFHEERIGSQTKVLKQLTDIWQEKMHTSGFAREEIDVGKDNWLTEMAKSLAREQKNLSSNVRFIK